jgi:hypothetical protein
VASVADGYTVIIGEKEFHAYRAKRLKRDEIGPSLPTFSKRVEEAWIYQISSRSLSLLDREVEAGRSYALYCVMEAA